MMGLIIPGMADAFSIFLARNFMSSVPTPLLEAARIDGAGEAKIFMHIVLPAVKPLISVIAIQKWYPAGMRSSGRCLSSIQMS